MKGLFLTALGMLMVFALIRFGYGLGANSLNYNLTYLLSLVPDVKEDFALFVDALEAFSTSLENVSAAFSGGDIFAVIKSFFKAIGSFLNMFIVLIPCISLLLRDCVRMLVGFFALLFGAAQDPIVNPVV